MKSIFKKRNKTYIVKAMLATWWSVPVYVLFSKDAYTIPVTKLNDNGEVRKALGDRFSAFFKVRRTEDGYKVVKEVRRRNW